MSRTSRMYAAGRRDTAKLIARGGKGPAPYSGIKGETTPEEDGAYLDGALEAAGEQARREGR